MKPYQQRVILEKQELDDKIVRLENFIGGPQWSSVDPDEKGRMTLQLGLMHRYSGVLGERIAAFEAR